MGGFLGRLFGSSEALTEVVKAASDGIDALVHTDEEKMHEAAKARSEARAMVIDWMAATKGQNLARRLIAILVTGLWLLLYLGNLILNLVAVWLPHTSPMEGQISIAQSVQASAKAIGSQADQMNGAVMIVLAFYFSAPFMGDIAKSALEKFGKKPTNVNG